MRSGAAQCMPGEGCGGGVRRACEGGTYSGRAGQTSCDVCPAGGCLVAADAACCRYAIVRPLLSCAALLCPGRIRMPSGHGRAVFHPARLLDAGTVLSVWIHHSSGHATGVLRRRGDQRLVRVVWREVGLVPPYVFCGGVIIAPPPTPTPSTLPNPFPCPPPCTAPPSGLWLPYPASLAPTVKAVCRQRVRQADMERQAARLGPRARGRARQASTAHRGPCRRCKAHARPAPPTTAPRQVKEAGKGNCIASPVPRLPHQRVFVCAFAYRHREHLHPCP